jgi:hypothetical protein
MISRPHTFRLFEESNFDPYEKQRYKAVLEAGLERNGIEMGDVLAVTQDLGLWAICRQGVFRADLRGVFKKRVEAGELIPYSLIEEARVEPSGPGTGKIVMADAGGKKLGQIDFATGGRYATRDREAEQLRRVLGIIEEAWRAAG